LSWNHPNATSLSDHSRANFKGATYIVREEENGAYEIDRKDRGGRIELIDSGTEEENLRKARTRAQVMAKRNSNADKEAIVRIKPTGEVLGFGGKYEQEKRTTTPEEDLEELEDIGLRADDPVGQCIRKERKAGRPQDQAVAICLSKRDRGELEDQSLEFHDEDASEPNPDIEVNEDVEETLEELVEEHNSEVEKESRKATIGQLKSVYSRGRGAFTQTSRPGVDSATQWALARVKNAYLPLLKTGEPPNEDYVQDNDLLPEGHPKSTRGEMSDFTLSETDMSVQDLIKLTEAEEIFEQYQEDTELTVDHLEEWLEDPCRERASGDDHDKHIKRAMFLIQEVDSPEEAVKTEVPEELAMERAERRVPDELEDEVGGNLAVFQMEYASSFISRHKGMIDEPESISTETEECPSISESALRNWAGSHFEDPQI